MTIENCTNYGAVETTASYAGGILGSFGVNSTVPMTITGCLNYGTVKGMKTESKDININAGIRTSFPKSVRYAFKLGMKIAIETLTE